MVASGYVYTSRHEMIATIGAVADNGGQQSVGLVHRAARPVLIRLGQFDESPNVTA